jgi:NAD(P)-dependent dehydrogenase (short-subunit alcohol dehydrogenase family)
VFTWFSGRPLGGLRSFGSPVPGVPLSLHPRLYAAARYRGPAWIRLLVESPATVAHVAAKAGVIAMTRQFALEGARHGIRAVAISPGPFLTPASDRDLGDNQAARDAITRRRFSSALVNLRSSRPSSLLTGRLTSQAPTIRSTAARPLGRATGRGSFLFGGGLRK